jgi:hypothetical protein
LTVARRAFGHPILIHMLAAAEAVPAGEALACGGERPTGAELSR